MGISWKSAKDLPLDMSQMSCGQPMLGELIMHAHLIFLQDRLPSLLVDPGTQDVIFHVDAVVQVANPELE